MTHNSQSRRFSLQSKLLGLVLLGITIITALFSFELFSLSKIAQGTVQVLLVDVKNMLKIGSVSNLFKSEVQAWKDTLLRGEDPINFNKYSAEMDGFSEKLRAEVVDLKKTLGADEARLADEFLKHQGELTESYNRARGAYLQTAKFDPHRADAAVKGLDRPVLGSLNQLNERLLRKMEQSSAVTIQSGLKESLAKAFLLSLVVVGLSWISMRRIIKAIVAISEQLVQTANSVSSAGSQLSSASQQLSTGATQGAASLEETVASLEELSSAVNLNSNYAIKAATLSQESCGSAADGKTEIKKLVGSISDVAKGVKKIEEFITVIDDIAFQTNLLALNAAVEAARAGEQGKGFSVVAEAVRNLAQRSAAAAKDIHSVIAESVSKTEAMSKIADQSGATLNNIVMSVKQVATLNTDISTGSRQQSEGLNQINKAMNQLDVVIQGTAASAEETAASSEELSAQSDLLKQVVDQLNRVVLGSPVSSKGGAVIAIELPIT